MDTERNNPGFAAIFADPEREEREREAEKKAKREAFERACERIPALLLADVPEELRACVRIELFVTGQDEDGVDEKTFILTKEEDGLVLRYRTFAQDHGSFSKNIVAKRIGHAERDVKLFGLLCKEVFDAAQHLDTFEYTGYERTAKALLYSPEGRIVSDFITAEMPAVLSQWMTVPDVFLEQIRDCRDYPLKKDFAGFEQAPVGETGKEAPDAREYIFRFTGEDGEQKFTVREGPRDLSFLYERTAGEETKILGEQYGRSNFDRSYPDARELFEAWAKEGTEEAEGARFSVSFGGRSFYFAKLPKKLFDLINYFSPEPVKIPTELLRDGGDSVYLCAPKEIPDRAFEGNPFIKYLLIDVNDCASIGNAFKGSSLRTVTVVDRCGGPCGELFEICTSDTFAGCSPELVIRAMEYTAAEEYAKENGIKFEAL